MSVSFSTTDASAGAATMLRLGTCRKGWRGSIVGLAQAGDGGMAWPELERRLLEMGFVEGAAVEVLHEGPIHGDPIAVRLDDTTIAIRRRDANAIIVVGKE